MCAGLLLAIVPARVALTTQAPGTTPPIKRIVFLFSDEVTTAGNVRIDHGLRIGFAKDPSFRTEFSQEYLDLTRFGGEAYEERLARVLSQKHGGRQPDFLITIGPPAALFAATWGPIVFPGVPIVYVSPSRAAVSAVRPGFKVTGVLTPFDSRGTVDAALRLWPRTHRVVIVSGAAVTDHEYLELVRPDLTGFEGQVSFEHLIGLPMSELLDRVARLPRDTVILYLSIFRDGTGQDFQPRDALELVAARSAVPVFGLVETHLGHGIVGGHLLDWEKAGVRAAGLALRVMHGASVRDIPLSGEDLCSWMFDARQLKRWGIRERAVPAGSQVLFKPPSLWREHPWGVLGTILFILAETTLISALVLERRRRRQAQEQQQLVSAIVESSNDAIIGVDAERRIVSWNRGAQNVFGYTAEEAIGQSVDLLVPPQHLQEATSAFESTMAGRTVAPFETVRLRKDGSTVDVSINDSPIYDKKGRTIGISSTQRDITEHRRMGEALRRSEEHLSLATSVAGILPWVWYIEEDSVWSTEVGYSQYGLTPEGKLSMEAVVAAVHPEDRGIIRDGLRRALESHEPITIEYRVLLPSRDVKWFLVNARCQFDDDGTPRRMMGVSIDITDRKRAELETQRLHQELSHVARVTMMGELTSSLAHELNQPLTAILSNAQVAQRLLADGEPDRDELREILADIVADDDRAGEIIQRLRTLLKKGNLEFQDLDINSLVLDVARLARSDAIIKNVSVTLDLAPDLPRVRADRVQLQQVILNFILNGLDALMSRPATDRKLLIRTEAGTDGTVNVAVHDSGPGIPQDKLERVFEPFFTTKANGMGMGLAIARSILHSHGGRLWAENAPGGGATFTLALPAAR